MAQPRKTPTTPTAPAVVHDITERRRRGRSAEGEKPDTPGEQQSPRAAARPKESRAEKAARIEALKQQIASGEYNPDPDEIARKMIERGF